MTNKAEASRAPDEVQLAPAAAVIEPKAEQTVGTARAISADVTQIAPPPIQHDGAPITRSIDALWVVMVIVAAGVGFLEFLQRPSYAKRVLAFCAARRSQLGPQSVRPLELFSRPPDQISSRPPQQIAWRRPDQISWRPPEQIPWRPLDPVESDLSPAPGLDFSVKKVLETIKEAEAEMASSRRVRTGS